MVVPAQPEDEASMKLFLREATTLSQLDHKRIIKFYEVGIAAGRLYLAMEYVDAINLKELLSQRNEPRRVRLFCAFICQVLEALSYAHRLGFVHRDVKPGNVLVTRRDRKYCTKLADFGLAKSFEGAGFSSVTSAGECRGTMAFMAPEQLTDPRSVRPSADIFSTAATLYYFLSGHYPCDYSTSPSAVLAVLQADVIPLDRWRCDLPHALVAVVHRGLAKRPEDRFPSAQAMRRELIAFAKGQSA
jgi:serine/threonine-protein kinase